EAATTCYGVVGLADRSAIWENIAELLQRSDYDKGVYCRKKNGGYSVDVYIVVAYGVKITEVLREVQKKVAYDLNKAFGKTFLEVNVFVQGVREIK
ncbi:MAG: Asp23/Gls24 family envelope stress response protein, partial [Bacilli bacterium]|nr:Asp23/Gls24 family envelope stress response protein [Bacilli bacterium]